MKNKTVFITGANGLLGNHIVRELVSRNYTVKALLEPGGNPTNYLEGLPNVFFCLGDILDVNVLEKEIANCDYVIHAAASTSIYPSRNKAVRDINITGTKNIISACLKNNIKKLIHIGSANSFGIGTIGFPGNETFPFCGNKYGLDYIDSKYEAQVEVLKAVAEKNLDTTVVCPTFMLGRYCSPAGSAELVINIYKRKLPGYSQGGKNYVHVNDVAIAVANALTLGKKGETYILGHQNLNYKDAFSLIADCVGVKAPKISIPRWICIVYGLINEWYCKLLDKKPRVTLSIAKISNDGFYYDASKAVNELKMPQTPIDIAIKECFDWLNSNKLLN